MVKIVVGSTVDAIISEEKNNTGATSVVIGRSFAIENSQYATITGCKLSSLNEDGDVALCTFKPPSDIPESSRVQNTVYLPQKKSRFMKQPLSHDEQKLVYWTLPNFEGIYQPSSSSPSIESGNESSQETEGFDKPIDPTIITSSSQELGFLVELSWEVISEITDRFMNIIQYLIQMRHFKCIVAILKSDVRLFL